MISCCNSGDGSGQSTETVYGYNDKQHSTMTEIHECRIVDEDFQPDLSIAMKILNL